MSDDVFTGVCKWFNHDKGFGFIAPDDGGKDVFVHVKDLERSGIETLKDNDIVTFQVREHNGRSSAVNLKRA